MAILGVVRLTSGARRSLGVHALLVICLTTLAWAQAQPAGSATPLSAASKPGATASTQPNAAPALGNPAKPAPVLTSDQIQAAARQIPPTAEVPALNPPVLAPPAAANPEVAKSLVQDTRPPLKAKYDVSLIGHRDVGNGINFYSLDREIALGRELSREVEQSSRLINDPMITEYVNRIGQNLVRNSDARVPFTIKVIDSEEVNAFALPGGFFYVDSGLILDADNEAELAGVMAHEIAHVAARHATKNMTKAQIWNMAQIPLMVIGGPVAYAISEAASLAVPLGFLKFSRDAEREADLLGLEYDYATGYDPHAFVEFFEKLKLDEKQKHNAIAKAFSTHPMNSDRIKAAQDEIRNYLPDRPEYILDTSEFEAVKARLAALENVHRIGGPQDSHRPVLMRRTGGTDTVDAGGTPSPDDGKDAPVGPDDNGRPTLTKHAPTPNSGDTSAQPAPGDGSAPAPAPKAPDSTD